MGVKDISQAYWEQEREGLLVNNSSIGDYFDKQVEKYANKPAIKFSAYETLGIQEVNWTYADFKEKVDNFAKSLLQEGFKKNDHIAVWCINIPEWVLLEMACAKLGVVLVTINPALRTTEVQYVLHKSNAKAIFVLSNFANRNYVDELKQVKKELPELEFIYTFNNYKDDDVKTLENLLSQANRINDEVLKDKQSLIKSEDIFQIQFTSGTTGHPKPAMLTHCIAINNAFFTFNRWNITDDDVVFSPLPLFHTAGSILLSMGVMSVGATYITQPFFRQDDALAIIEKYRVTHFGGVPTMLQGLLYELERQQKSLDLKLFMSGGAPVSVRLSRQLEAQLNAKGVVLMGMTETGGIFSTTSPQDSDETRRITSGKPLPFVELRIVDVDTREVLPCNVLGEIEVRGYLVMVGYYELEEATKEAISHDGWLKTGDIGELTEEGNLKVVTRLKDMIIRGGENIYPGEIEDYLMSHPKVTVAQVIGIPDQYYGEVPMAFIKLVDHEETTEQELLDFCKGNISHQKIPIRIEVVEEFPLTASGKIQKNLLRENYIKEKNLH